MAKNRPLLEDSVKRFEYFFTLGAWNVEAGTLYGNIQHWLSLTDKELDRLEFSPLLQSVDRNINKLARMRTTVVTASPDANVERNRQLLLDRSVVGLKKYGVTTERTDLNLSQWLQHLLEELLDAANYVQAAKMQAEQPRFQARVRPWLLECFGEMIAGDREERNHRFLEEAVELVQACGCTQQDAHQLVDYVFGRPVGEPSQEVGGVMVTLAALCLANGLDMHSAGETELARIWTKVEQIRAKQAAKPKYGPLPGPSV